jgi:hypothetical protein
MDFEGGKLHLPASFKHRGLDVLHLCPTQACPNPLNRVLPFQALSHYTIQKGETLTSRNEPSLLTYYYVRSGTLKLKQDFQDSLYLKPI